MKKITTLPTSTLATNVLFLLTYDSHKKLEALLCSSTGGRHRFYEIAPDGGELEKCNSTYSGSTYEYKALANAVLGDISSVFSTDWQMQTKDRAAVYIHYPEKDTLTVGVQSISRPNSFCCAAIDKEMNVECSNSLNGYDDDGKRLCGGYAHYMDDAPRLLIISDCLEEMRQSVFGYLIEEAIGLSKEVITVTPDLIHAHYDTKRHIRESVLQVEPAKSEQLAEK